jgi:predicted RNase H-like HicB family nuclease
MTRDTYSITIEREDELYYAFSEDLGGVYGIGASIGEARTSILEAIRLYLLHKA